MRSISNNDDIIDSRDVIARIDELKAEWAEATGDDPDDYDIPNDGDDWKVGLTDDDADELATLLDLAEEGEANLSDWVHGEALIRNSYFEDYARELAEDIGAVRELGDSWPMRHASIDWAAAADDLKADYTDIDFDGVTYWGRS